VEKRSLAAGIRVGLPSSKIIQSLLAVIARERRVADMQAVHPLRAWLRSEVLTSQEVPEVDSLP
jgi:hypothetical protein